MIRAVVSRSWGEVRLDWTHDPEATTEAVKCLACAAPARRKEFLSRAMDWLDAAQVASVGPDSAETDDTVFLARSALWAADDAVSELERRGHLL